jgi:hypothetical protein
MASALFSLFSKIYQLILGGVYPLFGFLTCQTDIFKDSWNYRIYSFEFPFLFKDLFSLNPILSAMFNNDEFNLVSNFESYFND